MEINFSYVYLVCLLLKYPQRVLSSSTAISYFLCIKINDYKCLICLRTLMITLRQSPERIIYFNKISSAIKIYMQSPINYSQASDIEIK